jgi:hypothetical protein
LCTLSFGDDKLHTTKTLTHFALNFQVCICSISIRLMVTYAHVCSSVHPDQSQAADMRRTAVFGQSKAGDIRKKPLLISTNQKLQIFKDQCSLASYNRNQECRGSGASLRDALNNPPCVAAPSERRSRERPRSNKSRSHKNTHFLHLRAPRLLSD